MYQIQNISDQSRQVQTLVLPDGSQITIEIYFIPQQLGWFITSLTYNDFVLKGVRITNSPDILYQWRNILPFGLACFSDGQREPSQLEDFASGVSKLYILTSDEVAAYTDFLNGQI